MATVVGAESAVAAGTEPSVVAVSPGADELVVESVVDEPAVSVAAVSPESLPLHAANATAPPTSVPPRASSRRREIVLPGTKVGSMAASLHDEVESWP